MRPTWHRIVSADMDGDYIANDLVFYDATNRTGRFYSLNTNGTLAYVRESTTWLSTWDEIIPLRGNNVGPTADYLLFHDRTGASGGRSLTALYDIHNNVTLPPKAEPSTYYTIVGMQITPSPQDEVFIYDRTRTKWFLRTLSGASGHHELVDFTPRNPWQLQSVITTAGP